MPNAQPLDRRDAIDVALEPSPAGTLVRTLGSIIPGLAHTRDQIAGHNAYWRDRAETALTSTEPLLVGLGDSLTQGIGCVSPTDSYLNKLAAESALPNQVVNLSRSGARIDDVLNTQLAALEQLGDRAAVIVCTIGSNDLMRSPRVGALRNKFDQLTERLAAVDATVRLATLPDNASMSAKYVNRHLRSLSDDGRVHLADVTNHIETWRGRTATDGFHPNERGYEAWTVAFIEALGEPERLRSQNL